MRANTSRSNLIALLKSADDLAERVIFDLLLTRWRWRTITVAAVAVAYLLGGRAAPQPEKAKPVAISEEAQDGKLLFKRAWVDHKPKNYKEKFTMYGFSDEEIDDGLFFGFSLTGIPVKYLVELHGFRVKGDSLALWFPADDSKTQTNFKVTREKNGEFDLKLVLDKDPRHGGKAHTYYSRMDGRMDIPGLTLGADLQRRLEGKKE